MLNTLDQTTALPPLSMTLYRKKLQKVHKESQTRANISICNPNITQSPYIEYKE